MSKRRSARWRSTLYACTSVAALLATGAPNQALAGSAAAALSSGSLAAASASLRSQSVVGTAPTAGAAAQAQIALSSANLARATQALKNMAASQAAAAAANVLTNGGVPLSGLQCSPQCDASTLDPTLWINAGPLNKNLTTATASVQQTAQNAILNWSQFDLYTGEKLIFDQQGNTNWTVLNRVAPNVAPSQIFGAIQASGNVFVINHNGIIFGGSAQINTHSLVASSLDVGAPTMDTAHRNAFFLNNGIDSTGAQSAISFSYDPNALTLEGNVTVQPGATITTSLDAAGDGGFVYMFAPNVSNGGSIITPAGETMLVATQQVTLTPNAYPDGGISQTSPQALNKTFLPTGVDSTGFALNGAAGPTAGKLINGVGGAVTYPWNTNTTASGTSGSTAPQIQAPGEVMNTGLIQADRGTVILNGDYVWQGGVIQANVGATRTSAIFLDARLQLTLAPGSTTQILPYEDSNYLADKNYVPLSAVGSFIPGSIEMSGNTVALLGPGADASGAPLPGALVEAPGGQVNVSTGNNTSLAGLYPFSITTIAANASPSPVSATLLPAEARSNPLVFVADGATIDVSGLDNVTLPMSYNFFTFTPNLNEFADQPLQRDSNLLNQPLTFDIRQSGTLDGVAWVGTPLADVSGYIDGKAQSIDMLLTTGGTVNLGSSANTAILQQGSTVNVAGGYVQYLGGPVTTTNLVTADGRIVNIANASPLDTYIGVAGVTTLTHPHWGASTTETFVVPLLAGATSFEPGYVEGRDAGGLAVNAGVFIPDGTLVGGVIIGERQAAQGQLPTRAGTNPNDQRLLQLQLVDISGTPTVIPDPYLMPSAGYLSITGTTENFIVEPGDTPFLASSFGVSTPIPNISAGGALATPIPLSADLLSHANFGSSYANLGQVAVSTTTGSIAVAAGADLAVHPGGIISLKANGGIEIDGTLSAPAGRITAELASNNATFQADLVLGPQAVLDAGGMWVNDLGAGREGLTGGAYINGGSITLQTDINTNNSPSGSASTDDTGNIILSASEAADGSIQHARLDVSSGGRITPTGGLQLDAAGMPAGNGGNLTLKTYVGNFNPASESGGILPASSAPTSTIEIRTINFAALDGNGNPTISYDGTLTTDFVSAYGFAQGGSFTAQAPSIQIGGTQPAGSQNGNFYLPTSFFAGGAFSSYTLTSISNGLTVEADSPQGSVLTLRQRNFLANGGLATLPTGAKLAQLASLAYLPDAVRVPVNLQLAADAPPLPYPVIAPQADLVAAYPALTAQPDLLIDSGVLILGDPGATIGVTIAGRPAHSSTNLSVPGGSVAPSTGVALILGDITAPGGTITINDGAGNEAGASAPAQVWLGPQSVLNVAGTAITNTLQQFYHAGQVLPGGTVSIALSELGSALVAQPGALIDVSGAVGTFDLPQPRAANQLLGTGRVATQVWSDAGSISLSAATVLYGGSYLAQPGASQGNGGSLDIAGPTVFVQQDGPIVPAISAVGSGFYPGATISSAATNAAVVNVANNAYLNVAQLAGSGIATLTLSSFTAPPANAAAANGDNVAVSAGSYAPGNIVFNGAVTLAVPGNLSLDAATVTLNGINAAVNLSANYFALRGTVASSAAPTGGSNTLTVRAQTIDLAGGTLDKVAQANFISTGDIRLRVPLAVANNGSLAAGALFAGELLTAGNLNLTAAQVYPLSNVDFTLKSKGGNATIEIDGNGSTTAPPLSAGGAVSIDAAKIVQNGTLVAPLGTIRLGANGPADLSPNDPTPNTVVATNSVTLQPFSVTSVSLDGLTVPFGETTDGGNWSYDSTLGLPLPAPPAKSITLSGATVAQSTGATVNLSGGGDIQAMEFVPGTGGSRDVLSSKSSPNTYAIIPGYNPAVAPIDFDFLFQQGDTQPLIGQSVYLSGIAGLPAGYYTLLSSHYATLPGAYRVQVVANSQDAVASSNTILPDGTMQIAGYFADPSLGTRSARTTLFDVQPAAVWRLYSEIDQTSGNAYFAAKAQSAGTAPPPLPVDAGSLVVNLPAAGGDKLTLAGTLLGAPGAGGTGAEVDIAALNIEILGLSGSASSGDVGISAAQLSGLGADRVLIGGTGSSGSGGELITATANKVVVDSGAVLSAPEIMLVGNSVTLSSGSTVEATGILASGDPTGLIIGSTSTNTHGDAAFLAVSAGAPLTLQRFDLGFAPRGTMTITGATITGNALTMDAPKTLVIDNTTIIAARNIIAASSVVNLGGGSGGFSIASGVLSQLEAAQSLTLRSTGAINFFGSVSLGMGSGQLTLDAQALVAQSAGTTQTINAGEVDFLDSSGATPSYTNGTATLTVTAPTIQLGSGNMGLDNFGTAGFTASQEIVTRGSGSFTAGAANLTFTTPLFLVGAGSSQTVTTGGTVTFDNRVNATPNATAELGGTLSVTAASIALKNNALIEATSGGVTLHATGTPTTGNTGLGSITLGGNAEILATGYAQTFFDVIRVAGGGNVQLISDNGNLVVNGGASIDVSSPAGFPGFAGQVSLSATNGDLSYNGGSGLGFLAQDFANDGGGALMIDVRTLGGNIDTTSSVFTPIAVPSLFSNTIDIHTALGSLSVAQGTSLAAQNLTLTADDGSVSVAGTINASGTAGGNIALYGGQGVTLAAGGQLLATASDPTQQGGNVIIGTEVASQNGSSANGTINLSGGVINLANTANPANDGTVRLRAPLISSNPSNTSNNADVAIGPVNTTITGARSVTIEAFNVYTPENSAFNGIIDPLHQGSFYGSCTGAAVSTCSGTLLKFVENFSLSNAAQQKFASIPASILDLQPGIELVNDNTAVNNGDITVASTWNLGAGFATTNADGTFNAITNLLYRVGASVTGQPGTLTLRAVGNINVNASITDGFFLTQNRLDPTYLAAMNSWIARNTSNGASLHYTDLGGTLLSNAATYLSPPPVAPYVAGANAISPVATAGSTTNGDAAPLAAADLFPLVNGTTPIESWSYRLVAGADVTSADPLALQPLATFTATTGPLAGRGNVLINNHRTVTVPNLVSSITTAGVTTGTVLEFPTMVRTGTGSIDIAAGLDFELTDATAPGVVYSAGANSPALPDPGATVTIGTGAGSAGGSYTASNPAGFLAPQILSCEGEFLCNPYGAITAAAFPVGGGNLTVTAQQDIIGIENTPSPQYYAPWLIAQSSVLSDPSGGVFSPQAALSAGGAASLPLQTSWWINFGSFDQGLMSVGGNVAISAGRDINQLGVSLPTTARVSGGLSSQSAAVMNLEPSGNLTVTAGRNINSGAYYEGSGSAVITAGGSVAADWSSTGVGGATSGPYSVSTVLAVDTGTISLNARGSIDIAGIVSGASMRNLANFKTTTPLNEISSLFMSGYGPQSAVTLTSVSGSVVTNSLADAYALIENSVYSPNGLTLALQDFGGVNFYPASFAAAALLGNVQVADAFTLAASNNGTLNLLAQGSLHTYTDGGTVAAVPNTFNRGAAMSTGPSVVEQAFDPLNPNARFGPTAGSAGLDLGPALLHTGDTTPDLFYAVSGDIISGPAGASLGQDASPLEWEINKLSVVHAGGNIVDLPFFGQNLAASDVTQIIAGGSIFYTGAWQQSPFGPVELVPNNGPQLTAYRTDASGLNLAGPGFFDIEAGGTVGPFVTPATEKAIINFPTGTGYTDATGIGIITWGDDVVVGNRLMWGEQFTEINGTTLAANGFAFLQNPLLPRQGADIIVNFGVGKSTPNYSAVINTYIDPNAPAGAAVSNYLPQLQTFLQATGYGALSTAQAWTVFQTLPPALQQAFVDKIVFAELAASANPAHLAGYAILNLLFPSAAAYHGDIDMLHATIKTMQGDATPSPATPVVEAGNIFLLGPGGGINVGTTATEANGHLTASALGVLTLDGGGINSFTDGSVLVDQSRILTVDGGDIFMWSSNGNLDAGRGQKTTVDYTPFSVAFDPADNQLANLSGLVTGAGIGTIQATPTAAAGSVKLFAPHGFINFGAAGVRSTGNLDVSAVTVLNAANSSVAGATSGVPTAVSVNLGALENAGATAGATTQAAQAAANAAANRNLGAAAPLPSLITVRVLGYGNCDANSADCGAK